MLSVPRRQQGSFSAAAANGAVLYADSGRRPGGWQKDSGQVHQLQDENYEILIWKERNADFDFYVLYNCKASGILKHGKALVISIG